MFDIAYLPELMVDVARMEKSKFWERISKLDLSNPLAGFVEMIDVSRCNYFIAYWGFIYHTHGGI